MPFKLGKRAPKKNRKSLSFKKYVPKDTPIVIQPPNKIFLEYLIPPDTIGMFLNDQYGCCVLAMIAHWIMLITAHAGKMVVPTDADVLKAYEALCPGFDPTTDANDNGVAITDALEYWQTVGMAGHKIDGWATLDPKNLIHRRLGLYLFLGVGVGVQLPALAQTQFANGQTWDVAADDGGIAGGHAVLQSGEGSDGHNYESWGKGDQKGTNAWDQQCTDETYIVLTHDMIEDASGKSPFGFDYATLQANMKMVGA